MKNLTLRKERTKHQKNEEQNNPDAKQLNDKEHREDVKKNR
jgi:hypothetical protein